MIFQQQCMVKCLYTSYPIILKSLIHKILHQKEITMLIENLPFVVSLTEEPINIIGHISIQFRES